MIMTKNKLALIAAESLEDISTMTGTILYSASETLKPGDYYFLGLNPGGDQGTGAILADAPKEVLKRTENAYLDENWVNKREDSEKGKALLQKRVQWLLASLGKKVEEVCASNLIFVQTADAGQIEHAWLQKCIPVHEAILEVVQPKVILAFGNGGLSPFSALQRHFGQTRESFTTFPSGHGNWTVKRFETHVSGRNIQVIGLPHLSRYAIDKHPAVIEWIKQSITTTI